MDARTSRPSNRTILWSLAVKAWAFRGRVLAAMALLILAKVASVGVPLILKRIVDALSRPESLVALPALLLAGYALARFAATLFSKGALLVCNDTGVSHVAAAVGARSVVVASGSDVRRMLNERIRHAA